MDIPEVKKISNGSKEQAVSQILLPIYGLRAAWLKFWCDSRGRAKLAPLATSRLFWSVLALKLIFGCLFASDYLLKLFVPFLEYFAAHPLTNPYAHFLQLGEPRAFPYPAMMLDMMALPFFLVSQLTGDAALPLWGAIALARVPLLLADFTIFAVLVRWLKPYFRQVLLLYWCSPVLFYITYMHGQLDVIPIALLFVFLYFLFSERLSLAAIALGLGMAAKMHLVLVLPFFMIYVYRYRMQWTAVVQYAGVAFAAFLLPNLPWILDSSFFQMVLENSEQQKVILAALPLPGGILFYVIPAVYLMLLFSAFRFVIQSRDLFLMFLGFSFGVIMLFIPPMPGWYYWIIPFFAYFFSRSPENVWLLMLLQGAWLVFFALIPTSDYFQLAQPFFPTLVHAPGLYQLLLDRHVNADIFVNTAFTLMQTALALNCLWIYQKGLQGVQKRKLISHSFLLGIGGESGSGKTTLAQDICSLFTPRHATIICGDDMHKWQRGHEKWSEMTHLDPKANELHRELQYLTRLRRRQAILRRHYDHKTGQFTDEKAVRALPLVIYEGLHSLYLKPTRELFDLKIFLEPQANLLLHRKIQRDMRVRNYSREKIIAVLEQRAGDSEKYISVQEKNADIVISFRLKKDFSAEVSENMPSDPDIYLRICCANKFYLDPLIESLSAACSQDIAHSYDADDRQVIRINEPVAQDVLSELGERYIPGFQDIGIYEPQWRAGWNGLVQLFVVFCLFHEVSADDGA